MYEVKEFGSEKPIAVLPEPGESIIRRVKNHSHLITESYVICTLAPPCFESRVEVLKEWDTHR